MPAKSSLVCRQPRHRRELFRRTGQLLMGHGRGGIEVNPGYSRVGQLMGLAKMRGVMRTVAAFRAGRVS